MNQSTGFWSRINPLKWRCDCFEEDLHTDEEQICKKCKCEMPPVEEMPEYSDWEVENRP